MERRPAPQPSPADASTDATLEATITEATIWLATLLSIVAATVAIGLEAIGDVSTGALVVTVAVVGFVASWVVSGRAARPPRLARHRVAVVPIRVR